MTAQANPGAGRRTTLPTINLVNHVAHQGDAEDGEVVACITASSVPFGSTADTSITFDIVDAPSARVLAQSRAFRVSQLKRGYLAQLRISQQLPDGEHPEVRDMVVRLSSSGGRLGAGEFTVLFTK